MLQTRSGKRTAKAALKIAVDMAHDGLITEEEAVMRADPLALDFPTVEDGATSMKFIQAAVDSNAAGGVWTDCTLDF